MRASGLLRLRRGHFRHSNHAKGPNRGHRARDLDLRKLVRNIGRISRSFSIAFDNYYTTHSDENRYFAEHIFSQLQSNGHIVQRTITQAYDPVEEMFLPDRFIRGTCPRCSAQDQNGDNCELCGATYTPTELKDSVSVISGAAPVTKDSEHYFVKLADFDSMLRDWTGSGRLQTEVKNKLSEWFETGLQDWDISRDAPYFGFEIPGASGKYFYVWLDAPIGYMASFRNLCDRSDLATSMPSGARMQQPSCTILLAKIFFTSTPCSGPRCFTAAAFAPRRPYLLMVS